jgi:hypothetical protein
MLDKDLDISHIIDELSLFMKLFDSHLCLLFAALGHHIKLHVRHEEKLP